MSDLGDETVLEAALVDGEAGIVTSATEAVESPTLAAEALAGVLRTMDDGYHQIEINGELWETTEAGDFARDAPRGFRPVQS